MTVRYYNSSKVVVAACKAMAQKVLDVLYPSQGIPGVRNQTFQWDVYSCGQYVLHAWEGLARQLCGEGWPVDRPSSGS